MNTLKSYIIAIHRFFMLFLFVTFSIWFLRIESAELFPTLFCLYTVIIMSLLITKIPNKLFDFWYMEPSKNYYKANVTRIRFTNEMLYVAAFGVIFIIIANIFAGIFFGKLYGNIGFFNAYELHSNAFLSTSKFFHIASNWYDGENFSEYIKIFPLYPVLLKIFSVIANPYVFVFLLNNIVMILSGVLIYCIACIDFNQLTGFKAAALFYFNPLGFFLMTPLHVSLLLFLCLLYVFFVRKRLWFYSAIVGFLAGLTDPFAFFLVVFAIIEYISSLREEIAQIRFENEINLNHTVTYFIFDKIDNSFIYEHIYKGLFLLALPFAPIFYTLINNKVFFNKVNLLLLLKDFTTTSKNYFFSNAFLAVSKYFEAKSSSIPVNSVSYSIVIFSLFFIPFILIVGYNKIRASYFVYTIIFYAMYFGQSDIIRGNNSAILCFPIIIILASVTDDLFISIFILLFDLFFLFIFYSFYFSGYPIY